MKLPLSIPRMLLLLVALGLLAAPAPSLAAIEWLAIGDPGNPDDSQPQGFFGSVDYAYSISRFETTNADYAAFLNAKAASDPLGLYDTDMNDDQHGGITRTGVSGSYVYAAKAGFEAEPVNFVSYFDALRFANWVHNGEGDGDTETGAYTLLGGTETPSNGSTIERNPGATVVVPNQDEWFKAAYYDPVGGAYYDYPTGTDDTPTCASPTALPNRANCGNSTIRGVTDVGAYTGSASPYGTFDQGGNVNEWNENAAFGGGRAVRGGGWTGLTTPLRASSVGSFDPTVERNDLGFRLVILEADPGGGPLDTRSIQVTKLVDRQGSEVFGYVFEACIEGSGILAAEVVRPGGFPLLLQPDFPGTYCYRDLEDNAAELDLSYPSGSYVFNIFGESEIDSKTLILDAAEPGAYLEILSPLDGATVPSDEDLIFSWALSEKSNGVGCIAAASCADAISLRVDEFSMAGPASILDEILPTTSTGSLLPASELEVGDFYFARIGTVAGTTNPADTTDLGDPVETRATWEDVNSSAVEVPEPVAGLRTIAALLTLAGWRRARRRRT